LVARIGTTGTDLTFTGASALLHALTQSPAVPALNAAAAAARVWEMRARRDVWRRREPELCRPGIEVTSGPLTPPGPRPCPLPHGPIEGYRGKLGPTALGAALGLLPLTFAPSRSADLLKALTPKAAVQGREAFAGVLDVRMCGRGVLPMDGSAYRRLDRVSAVVVDGATLCTGHPVVVEVALDPAAEAAGWDAVSLWTGRRGCSGRRSTARRRGGCDSAPPAPIPTVRVPGYTPCASPTASGSAPQSSPTSSTRTRRRCCTRSRRRGTGSCSPRTRGSREGRGPRRRGRAAGGDLLETVQRVQAQGPRGASGRLLGRAARPAGPRRRGGRRPRTPGLALAADVGRRPDRSRGGRRSWGADLVTGPGPHRGLPDRSPATAAARALSRQCGRRR
jgi:cation-transporting ATPase I